MSFDKTHQDAETKNGTAKIIEIATELNYNW